MPYSTMVNILEARREKEQKVLILRVQCLQGMITPAMTVIYLKDTSYTRSAFRLLEIVLSSPNNYTLRVQFDVFDWLWERIERILHEHSRTTLCSIDEETHARLSPAEQLEYLHELIALLGKGRVPSFLQQNILPAFFLMPAQDHTPLSLSTFGGLALAPPEFIYPHKSNGEPLLFVGQFHPGELYAAYPDLPYREKFPGSEGMVYVFAEQDTQEDYHGVGTIHLRYYNMVSAVGSVAPLSANTEVGIFPEQPMQVVLGYTIPPEESSLWQGEKKTEEERSSYSDIENILIDKKPAWLLQWLGHPTQIQGCLLAAAQDQSPNSEILSWSQERDERQLAEVRRWRHLLSVDAFREYFSEYSLSDGHFNESTEGIFSLFLPTQDIDSMKFEAMECVYQCT